MATEEAAHNAAAVEQDKLDKEYAGPLNGQYPTGNNANQNGNGT